MPLIEVADASPGMVLSADVHDPHGRLVMRAGTELTDRHVHALRTWGVPQVEVAGDEAEDAGGSGGAESVRVVKLQGADGAPQPFALAARTRQK